MVSYGGAIWLLDCKSGALLQKQSFVDGERTEVDTGPSLSHQAIYFNGSCLFCCCLLLSSHKINPSAGGELIKIVAQ